MAWIYPNLPYLSLINLSYLTLTSPPALPNYPLSIPDEDPLLSQPVTINLGQLLQRWQPQAIVEMSITVRRTQEKKPDPCTDLSTSCLKRAEE